MMPMYLMSSILVKKLIHYCYLLSQGVALYHRTYKAKEHKIGSCHIIRKGRVRYRSTMIFAVMTFSSALAWTAQF